MSLEAILSRQIFVIVPTQDYDFLRHISWFSLIFFLILNDLRWQKIVRFVDIGGIVDHHYLNFVFIMKKNHPFNFLKLLSHAMIIIFLI
jgi:hypothetical protein